MKHLDLASLSLINLGELIEFLCWVDRVPTGIKADREVKEYPHLRSENGIRAVVKIACEFDFIDCNPAELRLTVRGRRFSRKSLTEKMADLRSQLLEQDYVKEITEMLAKSASGRLQVEIVYWTLGLKLSQRFSVEDIEAFIRWAHWCELFYHDSKKSEIASSNRPHSTLHMPYEAHAPNAS